MKLFTKSKQIQNVYIQRMQLLKMFAIDGEKCPVAVFRQSFWVLLLKASLKNSYLEDKNLQQEKTERTSFTVSFNGTIMYK